MAGQAGTHLDLVPMESRSKWTQAYAGVTQIVVDQEFPEETPNKYGTHSSRASSLPQDQAMVGASLLATILVQTFPKQHPLSTARRHRTCPD
jgi:hypothetical protein